MLKGVIQGEMKGHGIITEEIKNTSKGGNMKKGLALPLFYSMETKVPRI